MDTQPLRIDLVTCLPELVESPLRHSILKRAQQGGHLVVNVVNLRAYGLGPHYQLDDYPYGGGSGMVMKPEPIAACIRALSSPTPPDAVVFLTPDGKPFDQPTANRYATYRHLVLFAGHYKGVDQRVRDACFTEDVSIGDVVLTGGELPALVVVDAVARLLPGVLGDETSALLDSFQDELLEAPLYTRPAEWEGRPVPPVLLSGNPKHIQAWQDEQALAKTRARRPDLLPPEAEPPTP